jgi:hypothetical protein
MTVLERATRSAVAGLAVIAMTACANSQLGNVLGSVLGTGGSTQLSGTIQGVNTQSQQVGITQSNGQTVGVGYDNQTVVLYQNQSYPVTALEMGDQVIASIRDAGNGGYYADTIQVTQSVQNGRAGNGSQSVQSFQGTVRQIDYQNGVFTINNGAGYEVSVSMPYNPRQQDVDYFRRLARGQRVRFYGVALNSERIELRQFY